MNANKHSYRILCIGEMWEGSNARSAFMALRRLGHSIHVIDEHLYHPAPWRSTQLRIARRILRPLLVRELCLEAKRLADIFRPQGVFIFKGNAVHPALISFYKNRGVPVVNFYPDVSFWVHGPYIPCALPLYDHIFTSKSWGISDMQKQLGINSISFLEYGFDPEFDHPVQLNDEELNRYRCDVVFVGTWSPKKEKLLAHLKRGLPNIRMMIWGLYWDKAASPELEACIVGDQILGEDYSKVLQGASICLGILSEIRQGASSGDLITSRTFNIPACGAFMLHERNQESVRYFKEDEEAAFFESADEMVEKVQFYLRHPEKRLTVAKQGRERCLRSDYSLDNRMKSVIKYFDDHLAG
jgi:glycosyltransferase involved in cell wall biosynthesis